MSLTHDRARVAALTRSRASDDPELLDARRSLRTEKLAAFITATVDAAPPLSPVQIDRLAQLLRGGGDTHGDSAA